MPRLEAAGIPVVYSVGYEAVARELAEAVARSATVLEERWGLHVPSACSVHVLTDGEAFVESTAPGRYRLLVRMTRWLWRRRVQILFPLSGGWTIPWRDGPVVGVEPPEMLSGSETSLGDRLFVPVLDPLEKMRDIAAHELTHAFTARLRLPEWLNEGVAMRAVDHVRGRSTVLDESRALVDPVPENLTTRAFRRAARRDPELMLRVYATGYWTVREWDESGSSKLRTLLAPEAPGVKR